MASVGIIIVNWNAGEQLQQCLDSIAAADRSAFALAAVVVVDNASTDRSADHLASRGLPLRVIHNAENLGFAAACNQGAAGVGTDYLLFLNPDTRLEPDSLDGATAWMEVPEHAATGILGIQLVDDEGTVSRSCARFPTVASMLAKVLGLDRLAPAWFRGYVMEEWDHATSRPVDHVIGAFYLIRGGLFAKLGGFDESFYVYFEDLDLSRRARAAGFPSYYLAEVRARHTGGGTSARIKSTRLFYSLRSRMIYARKHFGRPGSALVTAGTYWVEPLVRLAACALGASPTNARETTGAYARLWREGSASR